MQPMKPSHNSSSETKRSLSRSSSFSSEVEQRPPQRLALGDGFCVQPLLQVPYAHYSAPIPQIRVGPDPDTRSSQGRGERSVLISSTPVPRSS
jgi:hypothetical protein